MKKTSIRSILDPKATYTVGGKLWIACEGEKFFGPGPVELLESIDATGSINKAAMQMGMSYKKAWDIVNTLNSKLANPLVITQSGGEKGGGSILTDDAKKLIAYHKQLREKFAAFLEKESFNLTI